MTDRILIACTRGEVDLEEAGLVGPDWPWCPLAATERVAELWEAESPEEVGRQLAEAGRPPDSGGLWVGEVELGDDGGIISVRWRSMTRSEEDAYLLRPSVHDWLLRGRL
jgi:hypothetical protein